jgi:hypothetical protein
MSILQRPGWTNRDLIVETTDTMGSEFNKKFKDVFVKSGAASKPFVGGPHMERWKFIAAVIYKHPQLKQVWNMVVNPNNGEFRPWALKANHIAAVAEQPGGERAIELLKTEVNKALDSAETWEELQTSIHSHREGKTTEEHKAHKGTEIDTREKARQLARLTAKIEGRPFDSESVGGAPSIKTTPPTDEELMNADRAMFKFTMAPLLAKIPVRAKHDYADSFFDDEEDVDNITVLDAMGDYPRLIDALFDSNDVYEFMDKIAELTHDTDPALSDIAQQIFSHIKTKMIKGAEEIIDDAASESTPTRHPFMDVGSLKSKPPVNQEEEDIRQAKKEMGNMAEIQRAADDFWKRRGLEKPPISRTEIVGTTPKNFREDAKLTPKQTDQLLQEKYVKTRQYLATMEEQFRQR